MGDPHFRIDDGSEAMLRTSAIAAAALACALLPAAAQDQPNAAQPKPYKTVAITPPKPFDDPAFDDLRKQLLEISERRDRAALSHLVVTLGFFWDRENGNGADRHKSGVDNLAAALGLNNADGSGWDTLTTFAGDPTASLSPNHKKTMCSPADPGYDRKALDQLIDETDTDPLDWGYPVSPGVEVRAAGDDAAPVIDRLWALFCAHLAGRRHRIALLHPHRDAERQDRLRRHRRRRADGQRPDLLRAGEKRLEDRRLCRRRRSAIMARQEKRH